MQTIVYLYLLIVYISNIFILLNLYNNVIKLQSIRHDFMNKDLGKRYRDKLCWILKKSLHKV